MRALTVTPPWSWAIAYAGMVLLNRPEPPPKTLPASELIAIHAGKGWSGSGFRWLRTNALALGIPPCPPRGQCAQGRIVAVCRVVGFFTQWADRPSPDPWFRNDLPNNHAWHLVDVARLPDSVECRGRSGFFDLPPAIEGAIRLSFERWRGCRTCEKARPQRYGPPSCELREDRALFDAGGCAAWRPGERAA